MKKLLRIFICAALLAGCAIPEVKTAPPDTVPDTASEATVMDTTP